MKLARSERKEAIGRARDGQPIGVFLRMESTVPWHMYAGTTNAHHFRFLVSIEFSLFQFEIYVVSVVSSTVTWHAIVYSAHCVIMNQAMYTFRCFVPTERVSFRG